MPKPQITEAHSGQSSKLSLTQEDWNKRYSETSDLFGRTPNVFLQEYVGALTAGKALDLAAGEGRNAFWLAERGWQVDAVDLSDVAIMRGQEQAAARELSQVMTFLAADLNSYQPKVAAYDLVLIMYLHMPHDRLMPIMARAAEAVKPGGTFLVVGHDLTNLQDGYGGPQNPDVLYTAQDLKEAVTPHIRVDLAECRERTVTTVVDSVPALDCILMGKHR